MNLSDSLEFAAIISSIRTVATGVFFSSSIIATLSLFIIPTYWKQEGLPLLKKIRFGYGGAYAAGSSPLR